MKWNFKATEAEADAEVSEEIVLPPRPDLDPAAPVPEAESVQLEEQWDDIELLGSPMFMEIDPREGGPNVYSWKLSREPERGWATRFEIEAVPRSPFHPVDLAGDTLTLRSLEGQLRDYALQTKQRVARTNARYREIDLPRIEHDREVVHHRMEEKEEREHRARAEADALDLN